MSWFQSALDEKASAKKQLQCLRALRDFLADADADVQVWFRGVGDLRPDVLEIGLRGRRQPKIEAYWDGCLMAMV